MSGKKQLIPVAHLAVHACVHCFWPINGILTSHFLLHAVARLWTDLLQKRPHWLEFCYWSIGSCLLCSKTVADKLIAIWSSFATNASAKLLLLSSTIRRTLGSEIVSTYFGFFQLKTFHKTYEFFVKSEALNILTFQNLFIVGRTPNFQSATPEIFKCSL